MWVLRYYLMRHFEPLLGTQWDLNGLPNLFA